LLLFVSVRKNNITKISIKASPAISQKGALTHKGIKSDHIIGQTIKPSQNNIHINHIFFILSALSLLISESIDCNILIFHQVSQFKILDIRKTIKSELKVIIRVDIKVQIIHKSKIIFLPYLSDNCHNIGQEKKENNAYKAIE